MTPDELAGLDPRRDLALIQAGVNEELVAGRSPAPLYRALAERDPVALVQVIVGPQAPIGAAAARAALEMIDLLEASMTTHGLYRRLSDLAGEASIDVLTMAASRHPLGTWLVALSARIEGPNAGMVHLHQVVGHPAFTAACWSHAEAGHRNALLAVAVNSRRPEPAAALLATGAIDEAAQAAAAILSVAPSSPVLPWLAAVWGPNLDPIIAAIAARLSDDTARAALDAWLLPATSPPLPEIEPA
jgi:hypothetical protein